VGVVLLDSGEDAGHFAHRHFTAQSPCLVWVFCPPADESAAAAGYGLA
jgi:hypothetical protein